MALRVFFKILTVSILFLRCADSSAQSRLAPEKNTTAFDGYDLTSYFTEKAVKGNSTFQIEYKGIKLAFESKQNMEAFKSDPGKYFPEYGGWCAIAMAEEAFIIPDYKYFKIQEGKLLFFRVKAFFNGLTQWNKSPNSNLVKANQNYQKHFP